jgi:phosphatidylserine/phosphatidylglycerophosphate/cardiolipin synthase-like enzyme
MKPRFATVLLLAVGLAGCQSVGALRSQAQSPWTVCFSPRGGCTQLIVDTLVNARSEVLVQAYSFTSEPIAQALVEAHARGLVWR